MSRIDITVTERATGKLLANRGLCRSPSVTFFCADARDPSVREFADMLAVGLEISEENVESFLRLMKHVITYLEGVGADEREVVFSFYDEETFTQFLEDLRDSLAFLESLYHEKDSSKIKVEII